MKSSVGDLMALSVLHFNMEQMVNTLLLLLYLWKYYRASAFRNILLGVLEIDMYVLW